MRNKLKILFILLFIICIIFQDPSLNVKSQTQNNNNPLIGVTMQPLHHDPLNDPYDEARILTMLDNAQSIGAEVVGVDIHWSWIEDVSRSVWNSGSSQRLEFFLSEASKRNFKVLATVLETPCWASSDPEKNCSASPAYIYNSAYPPVNPQDYANFVGELVQKYKNQIQIWQIWNEPNEVAFFIDPDSTFYTALLKTTYPVIKAKDPNAIVLGGALSPRDHSQDENINALDFLENMYHAGAKGYFDAFAFHPYTDGFSPYYFNEGWPMSSFMNSIPTIREHMLANGDTSPIWITESGWTTVENCSNCSWQPELPTTEEEQADYLDQVFELIGTWDYLDAYVYYTLTDKRNTDPSRWQDYFGLFRSDLSPKPAADVFRKMMFVFNDIPKFHWAKNYIERLYNVGITTGCSTDPMLFCPEFNVTRAEMAAFLERGLNGSDYHSPAGTGMVFADVPLSHWAVDCIEQLYKDEITKGCNTDPLKYCPDVSVTRAEMALFLLRSKYGSDYQPPAVNGGTGFNDVPSNHWAAPWIKQLASEGITSGCGGGNYCPNDPVSRAEMALFLVRTFDFP